MYVWEMSISVSTEVKGLGLHEGHRGAGAAERGLGLNPGALLPSQAWEVRRDQGLAGAAAGQAGVGPGAGGDSRTRALRPGLRRRQGDEAAQQPLDLATWVPVPSTGAVLGGVGAGLE